MDQTHIVIEEAEPPGDVDTDASKRSSLTNFRIDIADTDSTISSRQTYLKLSQLKSKKNNLVMSSLAKEFRDLHFPAVSDSEWNDWHWQLRHLIRGKEISKYIQLTDDEEKAIAYYSGSMAVSMTPYYASLLSPMDVTQSLRHTVIPVMNEHYHAPDEKEDPLNEDDDSPVPGLVHRYPDRVLFLVTKFFSTHCRYCTRSRMVGKNTPYCFSTEQAERALEYIEANPQIRDVLISGGDPLTLPDSKLEWLLKRVRAISHVEIIRIGTKTPVVMPQRITTSLVRMLRKYHPLWMSVHFTHPDELTPEVQEACARLADAGIPLGSQTVLLKNVNDDTDTMARLMKGLLKIRVRPYYLYQCDPIVGSSHFRTTVDKGLEIIRGLRGHTSGYAIPSYVIDAPGGGGKIPLLPEYLVEKNEKEVVLKNYQGNYYTYPQCSENVPVL
jgi:lysine 2,3-aminomutase